MKFFNYSPLLLFGLVFIHICVVKSESFHSNQTNEYLAKINTATQHSKISACLALIRNNLNDNNKNIKLSTAISKTKFDKSKFYDKSIASMLLHCVNEIKKDDIEQAISVKNITESISKIPRLIDIDFTKINTVELSKDEQDLFTEIKKAGNIQEVINLNPEDEVGFLWFRLEQIGELSYYFALIGLFMFVVIVLGGMYAINKSSKEKKQKNKKKKQK